MNSFLGKVRDQHNTILVVILLLLSLGVLVYLFPRKAQFKYEFDLGKVWEHEDLYAPFEFAIRKPPKEIQGDRQKAIESVAPYYYKDQMVSSGQINHFKEDLEKRWDDFTGNRDTLVDEKTKALKKQYSKVGENVLSKIFSKGLIDLNKAHEQKEDDFTIVVVENNVGKSTEIGNLLNFQSAYNLARDEIPDNDEINETFLLTLIEENLAYNIFYDKAKTSQLIEERLATVSSSRGKVNEGEKVISKGEVITEEKYQKLASLKEEYEEQIVGKRSAYIILLGQVMLVALCIFSIFIFLRLFAPRVIHSPSKVLFILVLLILNMLMAKFTLEVEFLRVYLAPLCILPIIIRTFYDTKLALFLHIVSVFIVSFIVPNPFEFVFLQVFAGILLLYAITNLVKRSQFFLSAAIILFSYSITYFGLNIIQEGDLTNIAWENYAWFAGNAMLSLFAYPLIYLFEKTFGFLSDVSLLEIADANNPLLRQLNEKAPGTFQHSLQVANLAEEAIRKIGGDPLLVRAGAMYHDIGKMYAPQYFIENQHGNNPHDDLEYKESAKLIIDHVIKGVSRAKKQGLPDQIIDFIRTHHGTTRTEYFYRKALQKYGEDKVKDKRFRYPGPLPYSKETAVLMMADSVEAASKSIKEVNAEKLDNLVESIINQQMADGQFIHANVTFREITMVKRLFKKKLMNIYHVRLEYPE
jgi:putative nucleotidyltransferase with HDIG domain